MGQRIGIRLGESGPILSLRHVHPWEAVSRLQNEAFGPDGPALAASFVGAIMAWCRDLGGKPSLEPSTSTMVNDQVLRLETGAESVRLVVEDWPGGPRPGAVVSELCAE